jgi:glycosyltransferase involved in cell wall biosynthesis
VFQSTGKKLGIPVTYDAEIAATAPNYTAQCVAAKQQGVQSVFIGDASVVIVHFATDCAVQGYTPTYVTEGAGFGGAVVALGRASAAELRNFYAAADVLVLPSVPTATFREPWGLVVNEAFNQGLPVIATDAVGAAAGGLVRDCRNGLVVEAGSARALAQAMRTLALDPGLRARLGAAAREDVAPYTYEAWAEGFSAALASLGCSLRPERGAGSVARGAHGLL